MNNFHSEPPADTHHSEKPLESWKEIAAYLQRQGKTVRRWEKEEGLPVHRHSHKTRSSVYAYPSEIDAWRRTRKLSVEPAPVRPLWRVPLFAATILLCLMMVGNGIRPVSAQQPRQIVQQVWTGPGIDEIGRPSPDGRYISYINSTSVGDDKLALHDLVTGENRDLTHGGGDADDPIFTPDGKQIVFAFYPDNVSAWLKIIGIDGSNERTLVKQTLWPKAVSPDGSVVVGAAGEIGDRRIALVSLSSGKMTVLKSVGWSKPDIGNFSPDGRFLVYSLRAQDSNESEIYTMAVDGSSETELVAPPGANSNPLFARDGSRVVFTSDREGRSALYSIRVSDGKPKGLPEVVKADFGGRSLAFTRDGSLYYAQTIDREDAYTAELDPATWKSKGPATPIVDRKIEGGLAAPTWSPDGKWIAYVADRGRAGHFPGDATFVIRSTESGQEREFSAKVRNVLLARLFHWFPDGKSLVFLNYGPQPMLQRLDLQTGDIRKLLNASHYYAVTPDGRAILYPQAEKLGGKSSETDPFLVHLLRHDVETGAERELTRFRTAQEVVFSLSASPDGRYIAYISSYTPNGNSIWIAPLAGGEQREVLRVRGGRTFGINSGIGWDPQGKGLVCTIEEGTHKAAEIWYIPIDGGEPHKLGINVAGASFPNISPDGRRIAFMARSTVFEVGNLKNLFTQAVQ